MTGAAPTSGAADLRVDRVSKVYERKVRGQRESLTVLDAVSFSAARGEFVAIIGPSGCGKSTILNAVAGLLDYQGEIWLSGELITSPGPERSVVFQHASLLPWRSVTRNVAYGLELRRQYSKGEITERVKQALEAVGLQDFGEHYPSEISGGMQQRANIARALVTEPKLVLMDEPFGALDALTRETLQDQLFDFMGEERRTTIFITHDIEEAVYLADKVIVMSKGPGRIIAEFRIPFDRPRSRAAVAASSEFDDLVGEIRDLLNPNRVPTVNEPAPSGSANGREPLGHRSGSA